MVENFMRKGHQIHRASNFGTLFGGTLTTRHLRAGSHRMSWTTERGQARKHPNFETSPAQGSAGSLRTLRNKFR